MTICKKPGLELFRGTILCGFRLVRGSDLSLALTHYPPLQMTNQPQIHHSLFAQSSHSLSTLVINVFLDGISLNLFDQSINQSTNQPINQSINQCGTPPQLIKLTGQGTTWFHKKQIIRFHFCVSFVLHLHFCISNCTSLHLVGIWSHPSASDINCSNPHG